MYTEEVRVWIVRHMPKSLNDTSPVEIDDMIAETLNITRMEVFSWGRVVPAEHAWVLSMLSEGNLTLKSECYPRLANLVKHRWGGIKKKKRHKYEMSFHTGVQIQKRGEAPKPHVGAGRPVLRKPGVS